MTRKLLGVLDLICVVGLIFPVSISSAITIFCGLYLFIKGLVFLVTAKDWISGIDVIIGFYMILTVAGIYHLIPTVISIIFLGQKGIMSLIH